MPDLSQSPVELVVGGVILISILFGVAGVLVGRRLVGAHVREGHNDVVGPIFASLAVLYAVVLGFFVILVWQQHDSAQSNSNEEASTLAALYRMTVSMPSDEQAGARHLLRDYAEAVINKEWDTQANGESSPEVESALDGLYSQQSSLKPEVSVAPVNQEFVRGLTTLSVDRNRRILASGEQLAPLLWISLFAGEILTVGLTFLLFSERQFIHLIAAAVFAGFIGLLLGTLLVLDNPFSGRLGIPREAFEHAVSVFGEVDHAQK